HLAVIVVRSQEQKSKGLCEVAGGCIVVGASIAPEPGSGKGDTSQLSPAAPAFGIIVDQVESVTELVRQIVRLQLRAFTGAHINLDLALVRIGHSPITRSGAEERDFITEFFRREVDHRKHLDSALLL